MLKNISLTILLLLFTRILFSQTKSPSETELSRIREISVYKTIDSFTRAKDLKQTAKKGDLIVLQDDTRKLYYGIIDSVRSPASVGVILYNEKNEREVVEATYDDLYYLNARPAETKVADAVITKTDAGLAEKLARMEEELKKQDQKFQQLATTVGSAGKSYEASDILLFSTYISFFVGTAVNAIGSFANSTGAQAIGAAMVASSVGTSIGYVVMRFRGHNKLKNAGRLLQR